MTAWTQGYVDGLDYTYDFYRELTPSLIAFIALCRGQRFDMAGPNLKYCELGCGQGFSTNLLAAANPGIDFHANDFNPAHIAGAQNLARDAALGNVHFHETPFSDFADQPSLPEQFDIIALHGIYSWVSPSNRAHIVQFINKKLKPGGLVYISYNTLPGWAPTLPLRRILMDRASKSFDPLLLRIDDALEFAGTLLNGDAAYFKMNPGVAKQFAQMQQMSRNYLAHEYFNEDWHPLYFKDVARELSSAKLRFTGAMDLLNSVEDTMLSLDQREILNTETDLVRRESLRDFLVNEQFRRDLFAKGELPHTVRSAAGGWIDSRFVLSRQPEAIVQALGKRFANLPLDAKVFDLLLAALSNGPASVREILGYSDVGTSLSWAQITDGLSLLVGAGYLHPCLPKADEATRAKQCRRFNNAVCQRAKDSETLQFLASPVTGGGLRLDRFEQLFLLSYSEGQADPDIWADYAWSILAPQGQRLLKDGNVLESDEHNLAELRVKAKAFEQIRLPVCKHLQVVL